MLRPAHSAGRRRPRRVPQAGRGARLRRAERRQRPRHARGLRARSTRSATLAALKDTGTLAQALKPKTNIGKATSQGVALQRVDKVQAKGVDGKGITIGALSDSYDAATLHHPGRPADHPRRRRRQVRRPAGQGQRQVPQPVVVLEDSEPDTADFDEGRAMLQIAHDVAPGGEAVLRDGVQRRVGFADNIRKLADKKRRVRRRRDRRRRQLLRRADVLRRPARPTRSTTSPPRACTTSPPPATTASEQSWNSKVHLHPGQAGAQGHQPRPRRRRPRAVRRRAPGHEPGLRHRRRAERRARRRPAALLNLQWDDPFDLDGATYGDPIFDATGAVTERQPGADLHLQRRPPARSASRSSSAPTRSRRGTTDLVLSVDATPTAPTSARSTPGPRRRCWSPPSTRRVAYKITVSGFDGDTGDFTVGVRPVPRPRRSRTDFNVLLFDADGNYLASLADNNTLSGRPSGARRRSAADFGIDSSW